MLRKRIAESLTARIFLITAGVLLAAGAITFSFIAWASPSTYTAVVNDDLTAQVDALVGKLAETTPAGCGELLDDFVLTSGANAMLVGPDGRLVDTGAKLTVQAVYEDDTMIVTTSEQESAVSYHSLGVGNFEAGQDAVVAGAGPIGLGVMAATDQAQQTMTQAQNILQQLPNMQVDGATTTVSYAYAISGKVMGIATGRLAGQADGKQISAIVRKLLA